MSFGERLRDLRKAQGLSQKAAAAAVGLSVTGWQNYEAGRLPRGEELTAIAANLGASLDWLLLGEGPMLRAAPSYPDTDALVLAITYTAEELRARPTGWTADAVRQRFDAHYRTFEARGREIDAERRGR